MTLTCDEQSVNVLNQYDPLIQPLYLTTWLVSMDILLLGFHAIITVTITACDVMCLLVQ